MKLDYVSFSCEKDSRLSQWLDLAAFDYINPDIIKQFEFLPPKTKKIDLALVQFSEVTKSEFVIQEMKRNNLQPATFSDLLGFAIEAPDFQRTTPVIALGQKWQIKPGVSMVTALWGGDTSRELNICSAGTGWFSGDAFLARSTFSEQDV